MKPLFPFTLNRNSKQAHGLTFWGPGGHGSGNLFDFSGQFDNGFVTVAPPVWVTGVDGGQTALRFDGTVRVNLVSSPNPPATGLTVGCWVKSSTTARYQYLMVQWGVAGGTDNWHMRLDTSTGLVYWNTSTSGSYQGARDLNGTTNICDGKWHLVVCTYDLINEKIYVDGKLEATLAATGAIFSPAALNISLGGLSDNSTGSNWLIGDMDEPRIYNYGMPANIVKEWYNTRTRWELRYQPKLTKIRVKVTEPVVPTKFTGRLGLNISMPEFLYLGTAGGAALDQNITQSLTITQAVQGGSLTKSVTQPLTITQSVVEKSPNQKVSQSLTIAETVDRTGSIFHHSASNTLSIIQSNADLKFKPRSVSQSLTITQSATFLKSTGLSNSLTITQALVSSYTPHWETKQEGLTLTQTVSAPLIRPRTPSTTLTIVQAVLDQKILFRTVTQPLVVIQNAIGLKHSGLSQSLTISQAVTRSVLRNKSASQSLTLTHSVQVQLTLNRSMTSTLVFSREHQIPDGTGGFLFISNLLYTRGGLGGGVCCPVPGRTTTIVGAFSTIVLPNPELGDAEAPVSAIKIHRTITGNIYTYARKNRSRKLKYKFVINRKKAYELRKFLLQNLTKRVTMTNWKGEIWNVNFLNDPVDLVADRHGEPPCGELYSIELDFEGVRIN